MVSDCKQNAEMSMHRSQREVVEDGVKMAGVRYLVPKVLARGTSYIEGF